MTVTSHDFSHPGTVSIWVTKEPIEGVHRDFLEGCDQLFMWLLVDYDVAIDGAFATNFAAPGTVAPLASLLLDLHGSESFQKSAVERGASRGIAEASFVVALYDCAYQLPKVGLPEDHVGSPWLTFLGAFEYQP